LVTDPDALKQMNIPDGETCVEIPDRLVPFFGQDGVMRLSNEAEGQIERKERMVLFASSGARCC
jgi:hypothetical protein